MELKRITWNVTVTKRNDGGTFSGTMQDDGLQSLWSVRCEDGEVRYASVLDQITYHGEVAK